MNESICDCQLKIFYDIVTHELSTLNSTIRALRLESSNRKAVCDFTMIVGVYGIRHLPFIWVIFSEPDYSLLSFMNLNEDSTDLVATVYLTLFITTAYDYSALRIKYTPFGRLFLLLCECTGPFDLLLLIKGHSC